MPCAPQQSPRHHSNPRICPYHRKREYLSKEMCLATCHVNFCAPYVCSQESGPEYPGVNRVSVNKPKGAAPARAASSSTCLHPSLMSQVRSLPEAAAHWLRAWGSRTSQSSQKLCWGFARTISLNPRGAGVARSQRRGARLALALPSSPLRCDICF